MNKPGDTLKYIGRKKALVEEENESLEGTQELEDGDKEVRRQRGDEG